MTPKILAAILILHLATTFGAIAAGGLPSACEGSKDFFCGTPLDGLWDRADDVEVSPNPFRFGASVVKLLGVLQSLTWYDYEVLNQSDWTLAVIFVFAMKGAFTIFRLYILWRFLSIIAQTAGRFLGR